MAVALRMAALMHVTDLVISCVLLTIGWMQEANPLAALIYNHGGLAGLVAFKMFFVIAAIWIIRDAVDQAPKLARLACGVTLVSGTLAVAMLLTVISTWLTVRPDAMAMLYPG